MFDSYPVYPCGRVRMSKEDGCFAFGLSDEKGERAILAVWNLSERANDAEINLKKYHWKRAERIYPSAAKEPFVFFDGVLRCSFQKGKTARLFCIGR